MTLYSEEYYPQIFRTLSAAELPPESRAALAVKAIEFLAIAKVADEIVRENFNAAAELVAAVESDKERDYLRRILLEAAQSAFSLPEAETTLDELLALIEGNDERQNALYARLLVVAKNLLRADDYATARGSLMERVEEIDDLRQYEEIVAYVYASDRICGYSSEDDAPLETPTGRLVQYDGATPVVLSVVANRSSKLFVDSDSCSTLAVNLIVSKHDFNYNVDLYRTHAPSLVVDALNVLDEVEKTLDTGVRGTGADAEKLDAEELEELRKEAASLVVLSPKILDHLPRLFGYAERRDAFDALLTVIQTLGWGLTERFPKDPSCTEVGFIPALFFPRSLREYGSELVATTALATKLAGDDPRRLAQLAASAMACLRSLLESASAASQAGGYDAGDAESGDPTAVFPPFVFQLENRAAKLTSQAESDLVRVEGYATLLEGRADGRVKTLIGTLVSALIRELDQLSPTPTRRYHKMEKFPILLRTSRKPEIVQFIESEDDPTFRRTLGAKFAAFDTYYHRRDEFDSRRLFDEFKVDLTKTDPLVAADEFLDFARFIAELPELEPILEER